MIDDNITSKNKILFNKSFKKSMPITLIAAATGLTIGIIQNPVLLEVPILIIIAVLLISISIFIGLRFGNKIQQETRNKFKFEINKDIFIASCDGNISYKISKDEILKIVKNKNNTISIHTKINPRVIVLNEMIVDLIQIEKDLSKISPIIESNGRKINYPILGGLFAIIIFAVYKLTAVEILKIIFGGIFVIFLVVNLIVIWSNKSIERKIKLLSLVVFMPIIDFVRDILKVVKF